MRRGALLLRVLAVLALAGCAALRPAAPPSADERVAYREAVAAAKRDRGQGIALFEAFVRDRSESPLADAAAVDLAELLLQAGRDDVALQRLLWTLRRRPEGVASDRARLLLAGLERRRGDAEAAYRTASAIRLRRLEPAPRRAALRLLVDLSRERRDAVQELLWLSGLRAEAADPRELERVDAEIDAVLGRMDGAELAQAAEQLGTRTPAARAELRRAERALGAGYVDEAADALERAAALPLSPAEASSLARLEARMRGSEARGPEPGGQALGRLPGPADVPSLPPPDPAGLEGTLGVALPLSGPFAEFGEESLQGILLAAGIFDAEEGVRRSALRLVVRDTQGSRAAAAAAVADLAAEPALLAIVGPLGREESEGAAAAAQQAGVPLLTLAPREDLTVDRPEVFRVSLTPRFETELLASYAIERLGARRFAILHPQDEYGWQLRALFWDAVERNGGEVVGVAGYDVEATDFAKPIRSLIGFRLLTSGQRAALAERERLLGAAGRSSPEQDRELRDRAAALTGPDGTPLPPIVDFDALFIPDAFDNVVLIAPQLAFHEVKGVRLLGANGWNHPDLVSIAGRHVEGAVFTSVVHPESGLPLVADFNRRFRATFGRPPDPFAAESFDATRLLLDQLARHRTSRAELRQGLLASGMVAGVSGVTAIGPDGNADKRPFLLGVEKGRIVSLDETGLPPLLGE